MVIKVTISGPQGAGKTQLKMAIARAYIRLRKAGKIRATRVSFVERQTKDIKLVH